MPGDGRTGGLRRQPILISGKVAPLRLACIRARRWCSRSAARSAACRAASRLRCRFSSVPRPRQPPGGTDRHKGIPLAPVRRPEGLAFGGLGITPRLGRPALVTLVNFAGRVVFRQRSVSDMSGSGGRAATRNPSGAGWYAPSRRSTANRLQSRAAREAFTAVSPTHNTAPLPLRW